MRESMDENGMNFESELADKEEILGEEIKILTVSEERQGNLGGMFRVADVEYGDKKLQVALGSVLSKQWGLWLDEMKGKACPALASIKRSKGKRYYSFAYIKPI